MNNSLLFNLRIIISMYLMLHKL